MFLIDSAMAATPTVARAATSSGAMGNIVALLVLFAICYLFLLRPQIKRQKEQRNLIASITVGDEVVTSGGILAKVTKIEDSFVSLQIADNTIIRAQKQAISSVLPKGTL